MFNARQSMLPSARGVARDSMMDPGLPDAQEYAHITQSIMKSMATCRAKSYSTTRCLGSEALQIDRLNTVLEFTEYAVLVREDATRRHQDHLTAAIEPQVQELLKMAEERRLERERIEERLRRRAVGIQNSNTPRSEVAAVRREELLRQHKERLVKEIRNQKNLWNSHKESS